MSSIQNLKVENFKGVRHAEISVAGRHLVVIGGKNGAGKSSFLDAFGEILDPKGTKLIARPIHDGQEVAEVTLTTDSRVITRRWTKNDAGTLTVAALDGAKYGSPSQAVKELVGAVPFDPLEFTRRTDSEQRRALLERVELPFDLVQLDAERATAFERRADLKRELAREQALVKSLPDGIEGEAVSASDLVAQLAEAERAVREHTEAVDQIARAEARQQQIAEQLAVLKAEYTEIEATKQSLTVEVEGWVEPDHAGIRARLDGIDEHNEGVRAAAAKAAALAAIADREKQVAAAQAELDRIDKVKADGLAAADFPAGLSVDETGITVEGVPFKQINSAKRIRVALDLVTQAHPDLRIVMIKDGSLLDSESLTEIEALAIARDYLVLVEVVDEHGEGEFVLTEGVLA
ncbi:recombinational DNA repair ATPase RecF [Mycetocola sp. BIGb0189]|uniref:AAA family ATPase n=1 Tax=Mycetocola sp. BIGb0189 TaxID=2940604 RepID=UPI0021679AE0|nr:AAA family ATPase [Mycetocola sp. BIGb0189]MCS4277917.1 recombinational DNA repair ATPase RecF [Mycetocola sp. BIGb0189]